jgi:hypothetical protein
LIAGFGDPGIHWRQRLNGQKYLHGRTGFQGDCISHGEMHQNTRLVRVGQQHDAFTSGHWASQPVIRVTKNRHTIVRGSDINTAKLRLHGGQFGALFVRPASQHGQFALALQAVKGFLGGHHQLGISHRDRLLRDLKAAFQGGFVQRKQQLPSLDSTVWTHMNGFDDAVEWCRHRSRIQCNHLGRGQRSLPHGHQQQQQRQQQPATATLHSPPPTAFQRGLRLAGQHLPAVAPCLRQLLQRLHLRLSGRMFQQKAQPAQYLAGTTPQRQGKNPLRPPLMPAIQQTWGQCCILSGSCQPTGLRCPMALQPGPGAFQPDQVRTVFGWPDQTRDRHQLAVCAVAGEHQCLAETQHLVAVIGHRKTQLGNIIGGAGTGFNGRHPGHRANLGNLVHDFNVASGGGQSRSCRPIGWPACRQCGLRVQWSGPRHPRGH